MQSNKKKNNQQAPSAPPKNGEAGQGGLSFDFFGLVFLCLSVLFLFSLLSFDLRDPTMNQVVRGNHKIYNWTGIVGAYTAGFFVDFIGFAAYAPLFFLATLSGRFLRKGAPWPWWRWASFILLGLCMSVAGSAWGMGVGSVRGGGLLGHALFNFSARYFSHIGSAVIWVSLFLLSVQNLFGVSIPQLFARICTHIKESLAEAGQQDEEERTNGAASGQNREGAERASTGAALGVNAQVGGRPIFAPSIKDGYAGSAAAAPAGGKVAPRYGEARVDEIPPAASGKGKLPLVSVSTSSELVPPRKPGLLSRLFRKDKPVDTQALDVPDYAPARKKGLKNAEENPPWLEALESGQVSGTPHDMPARTPSASPGAAGPQASLFDPESAGAQQNAPAHTGGESPAEPGLLDNVVIDEQYQAAPPAAVKPMRIKAKLPPLTLLQTVEDGAQAVSREELESKGQALMNCLNDFSIQAELVRITPGPVVTSFEVRPAPGVKSSRISNLSDDLALGLKAMSVRIQAPIPGTDTVGIEIPNTRRELVGLRELLSSSVFQSAESLLTLAIGKDSSGVPFTADLTRMPHMLVAGATGTGKSVFLNSVLMSLLYKARPEEVKFLLVDPKRIEMAVYSDIPHLVHPIVTDMTLAKNALDWAVAEMERRYDAIARLSVRNMLSYNEKLKEMQGKLPPDLAGMEPMPYLVIIIDELADLMLTAGKDVETSIVRLAQLARAAGIHLIIATQRPSVDVVTGLIKANFPCRISFQVTSKHDSRTILDTVGAEHLLGRGDMLYKPAGGRFQRLHGAFVSDEDVASVADYWRKQQKPDYQVDFADFGSDSFGGSGQVEVSGDDQLYIEAVAFVREQNKASISLVQRRFRIGFNKAANIIEQMEKDGIIGPADGSKPRVVR